MTADVGLAIHNNLSPYFAHVAHAGESVVLPPFGAGRGRLRETPDQTLRWAQVLYRLGEPQPRDVRPLENSDLPSNWTGGCVDIRGAESSDDAARSVELTLQISQSDWQEIVVQYPETGCTGNPLNQFTKLRYDTLNLGRIVASSNGYGVRELDLANEHFTIAGVSLDGRSLFLGYDEEGLDGSTPERRHRFLDHFSAWRAISD